MKARLLLAGCVVLFCLVAAVPGCPESALHLQPIASGLEHPLFITAAPGDALRLFVLEQSGRIRILRDGTLLDEPFLDLRDRVGPATGEQGLLGLAFHPDYAESGRFFVNYIDQNGDTTVSCLQVSENPDRTDPGSETLVLHLEQPHENHNGGMMAFGPDGYLYIATGDGGQANDPENDAQRLDTLLGKILRIDVDGELPYAIPPDNPFVGQVDAAEEIWAFGFRNPWRFTFDRETGDLWIGDVGQGAREEVNFQPAGSPGGENYGWRVREGSICRPGQEDCSLPEAVAPVYDYKQPIARAVVSGYVYRGDAIPQLQGTYFFADYVSGRVWTLRHDGTELTSVRERTRELRPRGLDARISSFGEDAAGELYLSEYGSGNIFKIVTRDGFFPGCR